MTVRAFSRSLWLVLGLAAATLAHAQATGAIRSRSRYLDQVPDYQFASANARLNLGGRIAFFADDNSNRATTAEAKEEGVGNEVGLDLGWYWAPARALRINLQSYVGYTSALSGVVNDGFTLSNRLGTGGEHALALDARVGDNAILSVYDDFSLSSDLSYLSPVANAADLRLFTNEAAVQYETQHSHNLSSLFRLSQTDVVPTNGDFDYLDRRTYTLAGALRWAYERDAWLSPYADLRQHRYPRWNRSPANDYESGLAWEKAISANTRVTLSGGYRVLDFLDAAPGSGDDLHTLIGAATITNQLNSSVTHSLRLSYDAALGTSASVNASKDTTTAYNLRWSFARDWTFICGLNWLHRRETDTLGSRSDTVQESLGLSYQLWKRTRVSALYQRTEKSAGNTDDNYIRNYVAGTFVYTF